MQVKVLANEHASECRQQPEVVASNDATYQGQSPEGHRLTFHKAHRRRGPWGIRQAWRAKIHTAAKIALENRNSLYPSGKASCGWPVRNQPGQLCRPREH